MSNHAHLLVCSGLGLAKFMRRLLTGYGVSYTTCAIAAMDIFFRTVTNGWSATATAYASIRHGLEAGGDCAGV